MRDLSKDLSFKSVRMIGLGILAAMTIAVSVLSLYLLETMSNRAAALIASEKGFFSELVEVQKDFSELNFHIDKYSAGNSEKISHQLDSIVKHSYHINLLSSPVDNKQLIKTITSGVGEIRSVIESYENSSNVTPDNTKHLISQIVKITDKLNIFVSDALLDAQKSAALSEVKFLKTIESYRSALLFVFVGIVTLSLAVFVATNQGLARPIAKLLKGTREIGKGNLSWRINIKSDDEFGQLARAFNSMVSKLELSQSKLYKQAIRLRGQVARRKNIERKIKYLAFYDSLTGLPNRIMFIESLKQELNRVKRNGEKLAVLFIDLDRFKNINDTLGHDVGDLLLKQVAERFKKCIRKHDIVARLGGDEFTLLLTQTKFPQNSVVVSERIIEALKPAFEVGKFKVNTTPSIGIAIYPDNGVTTQDLLKNADTAMYCAKEDGKNNYKFCNDGMNEKVLRLAKIENSLRAALQEDEFVLYYQPVVDINTGEILEMEALLRWEHPKDGLVFPKDFMPVAEETGIIVSITDWVLRTACEQNKLWQESGYSPMQVSVNISSRHFFKQNLESTLKKILCSVGLENKWLKLEINETCIIDNNVAALDVLLSLSRSGVEFALDDFGTGYSSLNHLKSLPLTNVKIDSSMIDGITKEGKNAAVIKAIVTLSHGLGLKVVAEGVETKEQKELLHSLNCDAIQGYLISRPLSVLEATELLGDKSQIVLPCDSPVCETFIVA